MPITVLDIGGTVAYRTAMVLDPHVPATVLDIRYSGSHNRHGPDLMEPAESQTEQFHTEFKCNIIHCDIRYEAKEKNFL